MYLKMPKKTVYFLIKYTFQKDRLTLSWTTATVYRSFMMCVHSPLNIALVYLFSVSFYCYILICVYRSVHTYKMHIQIHTKEWIFINTVLQHISTVWETEPWGINVWMKKKKNYCVLVWNIEILYTKN